MWMRQRKVTVELESSMSGISAENILVEYLIFSPLFCSVYVFHSLFSFHKPEISKAVGAPSLFGFQSNVHMEKAQTSLRFLRIQFTPTIDTNVGISNENTVRLSLSSSYTFSLTPLTFSILRYFLFCSRFSILWSLSRNDLFFFILWVCTAQKNSLKISNQIQKIVDHL